MCQRWLIVFVANFAGSLLLLALFYYLGLWKIANGVLGACSAAIGYAKVT